ncbi:MAG: hypothetical protein LUE65_01055 [Clostridiales bacterium]|nr:hypothetical protein [Clostridiales bacterium]
MMDEYKRELNNIYSVNRETAAMLMVCKRLDRVAENLEKLTFQVEQLQTEIRHLPKP